MDMFKQELIDSLNAVTPLEVIELEKLITIPTEKGKGNYTLPCFVLAKSLKKAPKVIAEEIAAQLELSSAFEKVEPINGFLNFYLDQAGYIGSVLKCIDAAGSEYGSVEKKNETVCIDFSSPNMGKELAFHHLRSTMIGNSLSRIYKASGYTVERINHLGDWGTSFGKLIVMYLRDGLSTEQQVLDNLDIVDLNKLYVSFSKAAATEPELEDEARAAFTKLEQGDELYDRLWTGFKEATLKELKKLYTLMNVEFDSYIGEAFFNTHLGHVLEVLNEKDILADSQERKVVLLDEEEMPPCLIQKSDGSTLYATRDIAAALYRKKEYNFEKCLYVVDNGQALHFRQVFTVLKKLGHEWHEDMMHIPFGLILQLNEESGKWEKGKTRTGQSNLLKDVFNAAQQKILAVIEEKNTDLEDKENVAMQIGISALVFDTLKNRRLNDVKFDWDKALSFEGDTGPYVQNAHVRLCSIMRKAGKTVSIDTVDFNKIADCYSAELVNELSLLSSKIAQACSVDEPYVLSQYALSLAEKSHRFIHHNKVLGTPEESERLFVVQSVQTVLEKVLFLIGVNPIRHM
ncbi:MAG: arginine--tRNA ligase [Fibrobacterales bacterium]